MLPNDKSYITVHNLEKILIIINIFIYFVISFHSHLRFENKPRGYRAKQNFCQNNMC